MVQKTFFFFFNPSCVHSGCLFFSDSVTVGRREGLSAEKQMKKLERKKKIKIKCWIEKHQEKVDVSGFLL